MAIFNRSTTFIESEIEFIFGSDFQIVKFDDHPFYKAMSGHGIKGVDFVAIHRDWSLILIEVKNYSSVKGIDSIPENVFEVMKSKKKDSLRAIQIIFRMYQRKFLFRLLNKGIFKTWMPRPWRFWSAAYEMIVKENYFFLAVIDNN